jgi:hypothetical protein|tara:strand:+ start:1883 stop:2185 length:303 start_codon:yes stop_codon:yes gene_type:complete
MIFGLIKSVLKSLELYLAFKNKAFYRDMIDDHREREKELINEIEKYRSSGNSNDALRADLLRDQLLTERRQFKSLSAAFVTAQGGDKGSDRGGDLPSTDK